MTKWLVISVLLACLISTIGWAGEKEELQWKYRALVAEFNAAQQMLPQFRALQEFGAELEKRGFTVMEGQVVEKPKEQPKPEAPKPAPKK